MSDTVHILVIPGDGIGREVLPAAVEVLRATGLPLAFEQAEAGWACFEQTGAALPDETLRAAQAADAILFGAVSSPSRPAPGYRSPIVALRRALDLYANIRPVRSRARAGQPVDLVVVRENTEGLYAGRERIEDDGATAIAERVITRQASERIARYAFELAHARGGEVRPQESEASDSYSYFRSLASDLSLPNPGPRPLVTVVHKANVLRETCGLFRSAALDIAGQFPDVAVDELLVDNAALQLVQRPERFDVIVTTNLFGDILSDVASYWGGGLGLAASANIGVRKALFEPVHGSAPDIAGRGIANPLAAIACAALLLEHLGRPEMLAWAGRIQAAVAQVTRDGPHTPDLGGDARTADVLKAVLAAC
jgi:homoisocitrate dehydrogenase